MCYLWILISLFSHKQIWYLIKQILLALLFMSTNTWNIITQRFYFTKIPPPAWPSARPAAPGWQSPAEHRNLATGPYLFIEDFKIHRETHTSPICCEVKCIYAPFPRNIMLSTKTNPVGHYKIRLPFICLYVTEQSYGLDRQISRQFRLLYAEYMVLSCENEAKKKKERKKKTKRRRRRRRKKKLFGFFSKFSSRT